MNGPVTLRVDALSAETVTIRGDRAEPLDKPDAIRRKTAGSLSALIVEALAEPPEGRRLGPIVA